jgi:hypothetical protein
MRQTKLWLCLAGAVAAGQYLPANAATTTYPTRAAWQAAVGAFTNETFEGVPIQVVPNGGGTIVTPNFDVVVDANHGGIAVRSSGIINGSRELYLDAHDGSAPHFHRLEFDQPILAFAADLGEIDEGGLLNVTLAGGNCSWTNNTTFFGVTSTIPFSSVDVRTSNGIAEFYAMDNVSFKGVPEPASLLLVAMGAACCAVAGRRRRSC